MDPVANPFAPGAGTPPPELAGRATIIEQARIALARVLEGRPARSLMLLGLRGVGKTVLLNHIEGLAAGLGYETVVLEAPEDRRLADMLVPPLRSTLVRLSRTERARAAAKRGLGTLRAFASAFKVKVGDVEFGVEPAAGNADSGALEFDLPELFVAVADAAKAAGAGVTILIDEVQYLSSEDLGALIVSLHRCQQKALPLVFFGAGLPQIAGLAGEAKSYAERLFEYPEVGKLDADAASDAIRAPVERAGVTITDAALGMVLEQTKGYPYFLQEWGAKAWDVAPASPITERDVRRATTQALARLDQGFFRVRLDRLTPRERDYVRAMAELGAGPYRSGEIARLLGIEVTTAGPLRAGLIRKGMIYSQQHGETAFTVPMFDAFMQRTMPGWTPPKDSKVRRGRSTRRKPKGK